MGLAIARWAERVRARLLVPLIEELAPGSGGWPPLIGPKDLDRRWGRSAASVQLSTSKNGMPIAGIRENADGWRHVLQLVQADGLDQFRLEISPLIDGFPSYEPLVIFEVRLRNRNEGRAHLWLAAQAWILLAAELPWPHVEVAAAFTEAAQLVHADAGYVSINQTPLVTEHERRLGLAGDETETGDGVRGAGWGTFVSRSAIERLGGRRAVLENAPVTRAQDLSSPAHDLMLLEATDNPVDFSQSQAAALHRFLGPVLRASVDRTDFRHDSDWIDIEPNDELARWLAARRQPAGENQTEEKNLIDTETAIPTEKVGNLRLDPLCFSLLVMGPLSNAQMRRLAAFLSKEVRDRTRGDASISYASDVEQVEHSAGTALVNWWLDAANADPGLMAEHVGRLTTFAQTDLGGLHLRIGCDDRDDRDGSN
jgi:hypothetical protein